MTHVFLFIDKTENGNKSLLCTPKDEVHNSFERTKEEETTASKSYDDVVNVSEGFQLRTVYKKKVKPSKLDGLLERRVKQFTMEEKQRLGRFRQASFHTKTVSAKTTVTFEESGKPQSVLSQCVKQEEGTDPEVKDPVVKKLDFTQEQMENPDNLEVRANSTVTKPTDKSTLENSGGAHKEVNGAPPLNSDLNSEHNCVSDQKENKEFEVGVNAKKRGYEDILQGGREIEPDNIEQSQNSSMQMNGSIRGNAAADSNIDPISQTQGDKPVLMNGNLHNDLSSSCCPPPMKVLKLENHATRNSLSMNDSAATNSELSCPNIGSCGSNITTEDQPNRSVDSTITNKQASSSPAVPQKVKVPLTDSKTDLAKNSSMMISREYSTRDRVSLLKFSKSKKARSGTALPSYRKFVTKSSKKSIFILPNDDLKRLARRGSIREVPIFSYGAKPAPDIWPYPSPRPTFGITWR